MNKKEGPALETLMRRLAETPAEFLRPSLKGKSGGDQPPVNVAAVVSDLLYDTSGAFMDSGLSRQFSSKIDPSDISHTCVILLVCHILHHEWFLKHKIISDRVLHFILDEKLKERSQIVPFRNFISDPERREELVRLVLDAVGLVPEGESDTIAADRLLTLDSIERKKIIERSRASQKRAQELREAMAKKRAEEAASKMMRE